MTPYAKLERQLKLGVPLDVDLPDLRPVVGGTTRLPQQNLNTAYFDTQDLRLWSMGITVTHRSGEEMPGLWTLMLPAEPTVNATEQTELMWRGERSQIHPSILRLIRGIVRHQEVRQRVALSVLRRRLTLRDGDGATWGELDDDLVTICEGERGDERFRQLELHVVAPASDNRLMADVLRTLQAAGARPQKVPGFALGIGAPTRSLKLDRDSSIREVVQAAIHSGLERLLQHDYLLRLMPQAPSEHDIHQARVATRRLRSNLKTLGPVLDPVWVRHSRDDLRWVGEALGRVRDTDVLRLLLNDVPDNGPETGVNELQSRLTAQRADALKSLTMVLDDERYISLLDRLHSAEQNPPMRTGFAHGDAELIASTPSDPARNVLPALAHRQYRKVRKRIRHAIRQPTDRALHRSRIGAKGLRYAAELAVPVIGPPAARTAHAAKQLQTILGEHHDAAATEEWLRQSVGTLSPFATFTAGGLAADQRLRKWRAAKDWTPIWRRLRSKKSRRWLTQ